MSYNAFYLYIERVIIGEGLDQHEAALREYLLAFAEAHRDQKAVSNG